MVSQIDGMNPPSFIWMKEWGSESNRKVHQWVKSTGSYSIGEINDADVVLIGVPLSRSSISASAASEFPDAFRRSWSGFSTYNIDFDVDLSDLAVVDLGDTQQHVTDIQQCHEYIVQAMRDIKGKFPNPLPIGIGGDHSVTARLVEGLKASSPEKRIGILQFDTHFDLRDPAELGPANGTPIRLLIEKELVKGSDVYNIGLHGFFNTKDLKEYADRCDLNYVTMQQARQKGVGRVVSDALAALSSKVDIIYVTCDMDVLDMTYAPGVPAATPGGMRTDELFEAVTLAGKHPKVEAFDIVCLDPQKDISQITVKAGTHVFLSFLTGLAMRKEG